MTLVGVLLLLCSGCCFRGCGEESKPPAAPETSSAIVDVPVRLEDVRKLHAPPDVIVTVNTYKPGVGGGPACGHSPVCVILLPIILVEHLAQEEVNAVTVTRGGQQTLDALYNEKGLLLSARVARPGGHQSVARLELKWLKDDFVIERGFEKALPGGGTELVPTSILSQLPLEARYRSALASADASLKGHLLAEAFSLLQGELDGFVLGELRAPALDDASRSTAVDELCQLSSPPRQRDLFIEAALSQPAPSAALAALGCADLPAELRDRASAEALPQYCTTSNKRSFESALSKYERVNSINLERLPADCPPERSALLRSVRKALEPRDGEAMSRALASDFYADSAEKQMDRRDPVHRSWILAAMRQGRTEDLLELLETTYQRPTVAELEPLLRLARQQPEGRAGNRMVMRIVSLSSKSEDEGAVRELRKLAAGELEPEALLALAARGDAEGRRKVVATLPRGTGVPQTGLLLFKKTDLAAYVLTLGGCDREKLELALKKGPEGAVEAACGK